MKLDLPDQEISLKKILFQWKKTLIILFFAIIGVSLLMAKAHPKRMSHAKEYNYLYSMIASLNNGREVNYDFFEEKLSSYNALRPAADSFFIQKSLKDKNFTKVEALLDGVNKRVVVEGDILKLFTKASINLERTDLEKAYQNSLEIKENPDCIEKYPFLYGYNLYRIGILEEMQQNSDKAKLSKQELKAYIENFQKSTFSENPLIKMIYQNINK